MRVKCMALCVLLNVVYTSFSVNITMPPADELNVYLQHKGCGMVAGLLGVAENLGGKTVECQEVKQIVNQLHYKYLGGLSELDNFSFLQMCVGMGKDEIADFLLAGAEVGFAISQEAVGSKDDVFFDCASLDSERY